MSAPTLDEWVKEAGFERLRDQLSCHFEVYGVSELDDLLRMCLISIRQELEDKRDTENNIRLRKALEAIANGSQDVVSQRIARTALTSKEGLERCSGLKKEK